MNLEKRLFYACIAGNSRDVQRWIISGANVNAILTDVFNQHSAFRYEKNVTPLYAYLNSTCFYTDRQVRKILPTIQCLLDHGANINALTIIDEPSGVSVWTPLVFSQFCEGTLLMEYMLSHGAEPNLIKELDGGSFYDSITLDYDTPEDDIRVDAKLELLKKYGAKSS